MLNVTVSCKDFRWRCFAVKGNRPLDALNEFLQRELSIIIGSVLTEVSETAEILLIEWRDGETLNAPDLKINIEYGAYDAMSAERRSEWSQRISDLVIAVLGEDPRMSRMAYYTLDVQVQYAPCSGVSRSVRDGVGVTSATW